MYTVLLAVDSNEQRARQAAEAVVNLPSAGENVRVVLLSVFEEFNMTDDSTVKSEDFYEEDEYPESVDIARSVLEEKDIPVEIRREHGDPTEQILSVADSIGADSIAMSGRKRSPTGKAIFGSVTQSVLLDADRPVIIAMSD